MVLWLYLKYAQNGVSERDCNACLGLLLTNHRSHAALTQKRKISDNRAFVAYVEHSYTPYRFELYMTEKKGRK